MKLNIATVGLVLLGFAVAAPEANAEPDVDGQSRLSTNNSAGY